MKRSLLLVLFITALLQPAGSLATDRFDALCTRVESLGLAWQGYVLGARLTPAQEGLAREHAVDTASPGTVKFVDQGVAVVADIRTRHVLVVYEYHESLAREDLKALIGNLFMAHDEPTLTAHDTMIYWAFNSQGHVSSQAIDNAKQTGTPLDILATVKLTSDAPILGAAPDTPPASAYVIISSEPLLTAFQEDIKP